MRTIAHGSLQRLDRSDRFVCSRHSFEAHGMGQEHGDEKQSSVMETLVNITRAGGNIAITGTRVEHDRDDRVEQCLWMG